ncbi:response regulator [Roseiconus nitratireducens]|uniref:response regulator n=1 Tax=Roseiconus nitratireducens TaxID=2605748 RepID=UPI0013763A84|nr:response regulator [Roseiconus nitratireducens]
MDDSAEDRARIRSALMKGAPLRRYHFLEASDGDEGLAICQAEDAIDCVIVDVHMPRLSGRSFLKELCEPAGIPRYPVIVLTGSSVNQDAGDALQLGAQDYVTKDAIYPTVLFRVIDNAVERHALTQELHASRQLADAASRAKSALIGNISHEIRTPMTAVMGMCDLLLDTRLTEDQQDLVRTMRENGEYLVEIVNDLLDLSKLEAGRVKIEEEIIELRNLMERSVGLMMVRARENRTQLVLHYDDRLPEAIRSDPIRIRQMLLNLISNAIKFSPGGQVDVTVGRTAAHEPGQEDFLVLTVADTGCGIPPEDLDRIFLPFVQSESKGRAKGIGGTGLGLAICSRLVQIMDGRMDVRSEMGQGSVFSFSIPLVPAELPIEENETRSLSASVEELLDGCRFLVAEDTRATQWIIRRMIEAAGGKATVVESGSSLLRELIDGSDRYVGVVTDIQMPEMDGLDATRRIRQLDTEIPILVLTADAVSETRRLAAEAGANDVLTKPIVREELLQTLASYCDQSRTRNC